MLVPERCAFASTPRLSIQPTRSFALVRRQLGSADGLDPMCQAWMQQASSMSLGRRLIAASRSEIVSLPSSSLPVHTVAHRVYEFVVGKQGKKEYPHR